MACKKTHKNQTVSPITDRIQSENQENDRNLSISRLLFGVDSAVPSDTVLQNNLTEFEWVTKNKGYPNFWGRHITGTNRLTKEEIDFLHSKGCKIAAIYTSKEPKITEEQGRLEAKKIAVTTLELGIPKGTAVFLKIIAPEEINRSYMLGLAEGLIAEGYTPGFKVDTDAGYGFDREYSRGMQTNKEVFGQCKIWAETPSLKEYERVTTTHLVHPDSWTPFAPSGITRNEIAVWQYGKQCHPIFDNVDRETTFNVNLVRNDRVIIEMMF